ncbi:hypothetical protein ONZ51_g3500 [Trametes cubensis]|uniref:Uncharacterized protein n=1 Tax=Trametes cubensis TaxID=1111947 RepID=A0AAD7XFK2_9APHY|nr:hypothetical protein ONZ51_g3500 [Trametes cubensis]
MLWSTFAGVPPSSESVRDYPRAKLPRTLTVYLKLLHDSGDMSGPEKGKESRNVDGIGAIAQAPFRAVCVDDVVDNLDRLLSPSNDVNRLA